MKKNMLFFLFCMILLGGCAVNSKDFSPLVNNINYKLNINDGYSENIDFYLDKNAEDSVNKILNQSEDEMLVSFQYIILKSSFNPILSNQEKTYKKEINKTKDYIDVSLNYKYTEDEFMDSNFIQNCFENYLMDSTKEYLEIDLGGQFTCLNDKTLNISVDSKYRVIESNGNKIKNKYTWTINKENSNNTNIYLKVSRDKKGNKTSNIIQMILLTLLLIVSIVLYRIFVAKRNKYN